MLTFLLLHIPPVQSSIGSAVAEALAKKIGSGVSVGRIDIGMFNRLIVDDVTILDQKGKQMVRAARLAVKVDLGELLAGRIRITSAQVFSAHFALYKEDALSPLNFQFMVDSLASRDTTKKSQPIDLAVESFIMRHSSVAYDRLDMPETSGKLNPNHLSVSEVSAYMLLRAFADDTLSLSVKKLAMEEKSGVRLNNLALNLEAGLLGGSLSDLELRLPRSSIVIGEVNTRWDLRGSSPDDDGGEEPRYKWDFSKLRGTIAYQGAIDPSTVTLADISPILPTLSQFTDVISLEARFSGTSTRLSIDHIEMNSPAGDIDIRLAGRIDKKEPYPAWQLDINGIKASTRTVAFFYDNLKGRDFQIPEALVRAGDIALRGNGKGRADGNIVFNGNISSGVGDLWMQAAIDQRGESPDGTSTGMDISGKIATDSIDVGALTANDKLGIFSTDASFTGRIPRDDSLRIDFKRTSLRFQLTASASFNGYTYNGIAIDGSYDSKRVEGSMSIDDPNVGLLASGAFAKQGGTGEVRLSASLSHFLPQSLRLSEKWGEACFSGNILADFTGSNVNDSEGRLSISQFRFVSPTDTCRIDSLTIRSGYDDDTHYVVMDSDFGKGELSGQFHYSTLPVSFTNLLAVHLPSCPALPALKPSADNRFKFSLLIDDTHWLQALAGIDITADQPIEMRGYVDDTQNKIGLDCQLPSVTYNATRYADATLTITTPGDSIRCATRLTRVNAKGNATYLSATASAAHDNLDTDVAWWGEDGNEKVSGQIDAHTSMYVDDNGMKTASTEIQPSKVKIGDKIWEVASEGIIYRKKRIEVGGLSVSNGDQYALVRGVATDSPADTLVAQLKGIEIGYILDLVNFHSVEFTGKASGSAFVVAPFGTMSAWTDITVDDFLFEGGRMGVLTAGVAWNAAEQQIDLHGICDDGADAKTYINGYVAPSRKWLDIDFVADGSYLDFLLGFTSSFISKIDGHAWGKLKLSGPTGSLDLVGKCAVNAKMLISPINCEYTVEGDTLYFVPNEIEFHHAPLRDKDGNIGYVDGQLHHQHLKNLSYDLTVTADNLLAYDFKDFGEDVFYGTVYGTGEMGIHGVSGRMEMDINVTPGKNSSITYNVASADEIDTYQDYIVWHDITNLADTLAPMPDEAGAPMGALPPQAIVETTTDMRLNFLIDMTPDATIRLLMDPRTDDYITLHGDGVIRATYHNKGAFNLFGTYRVIDGTYGITIQEIIRKNFTFTEGSTIVFGGNPFDANLNLQASYTVNGVSLSDLSIGNSYSGNTIRVNCLMNIGGVAQNPQITFDLDMPTVSTDEKQMIKSLINSEEEMNQQVIYLLGIGRFYPQGSNNAQSGREQSETSMAVNSFLSGTLSSQINQLLGSVIKSDNWSFGANISTGDEGWNNAEYEGLISGSMLNNRLLFNGQFGYRDNVATDNTSFIGDFDLRYLLTPNGNIALKVYNQSNDRYFTKSSLNTQGVGVIMKKDFTNLWDMIGWRKKTATTSDSAPKEGEAEQ